MRILARYSLRLLLLLFFLAIVFACRELRLSDVTGETIQSSWIAHGGELHGRLQQLHVRIWPGVHNQLFFMLFQLI